MTHMDIINRALVTAGGTPLTVMTGTDPITVAVKAFYENVWREVLQAHPWTELLVEDTLTGTEQEDGRYLFELPEYCVNIKDVCYSDGITKATNAKRIGKYYYSSYDTLIVTYVSGENLIPIDYDVIEYAEIDTTFPSFIDKAVTLNLAYQIAFRISQNITVQNNLYQQYQNQIMTAKASDSQGFGGQTPWGVEDNTYYGND